jgi:hypothetical protein
MFLNAYASDDPQIKFEDKITCEDVNETMIVEAALKNISTSPSYIKLRLKDVHKNVTKNFILENTDFFNYLKIKKNFSITEYMSYMIAKLPGVIEIDYRDYVDFLSTRFGNVDAALEYFERSQYDVQLDFRDIHVVDENQMILKYFSYDANDHCGPEKSSLSKYDVKIVHSPEFIAMLIDLGYLVTRGDMVPILHIRKLCKN